MCCSRELSTDQVGLECDIAARCNGRRGSARRSETRPDTLPDNPHHPLHAHDARDTLPNPRRAEAGHACADDALRVSWAAGKVFPGAELNADRCAQVFGHLVLVVSILQDVRVLLSVRGEWGSLVGLTSEYLWSAPYETPAHA
jgi:hypothetical protein